MKAVDPSIKLIASGFDPEWDRTLVRIAGPNIDELSIHRYYGLKDMQGDVLNLLAHPRTFDSFYQDTRAMLQQLGATNIQLNFNEWNTSLPLPMQHTMKSALYAGSILNGFERNGDLVTASSVSDLVNGWSGGVIQASRWDLFVTPTYLVNKLYSDHLGTDRLATSFQGSTFDSLDQGKHVPILDAIATRSTDGSRIFIKVVNDDLQNAVSLQVHMEGVAVAAQAELQSITADSADSANSFDTPSNVAVRDSSVAAASNFTLVLPRASVSVLTMQTVANGQTLATYEQNQSIP
jgi:alpha-N-arabinofuranosidase